MSPSARGYFALMLAAILRLLTLAALALMPFGMGTASASPAHHAPATAASGHCDDQGGSPVEKSRDLAGCTAACSMFIAEQARADEPDALPGPMTVRPVSKRWTSLLLETATPPPKRS